jgi:hypothetical protein
VDKFGHAFGAYLESYLAYQYLRKSGVSNFQAVNVPSTMRYRQYLLSLDIDLTKIKTNSKALKAVFQGLSFIKLPFPTLEFNSKGQVKGYWLY